MMNFPSYLQQAQPTVDPDGPIPTFSGKHEASDTWAWITRANWEDYKQRFWPKEDELFQQTTYENPAIVGQEIQAGQERVNRAIDVSSGIQKEQMRGYGIAPSADQSRVNARTEAMGRSTALTDAANKIRQNLIDRDRSIATGASTQKAEITGGGS